MTREQLAQCVNESAQDIFARVPMGKGYYERLEVAFETALNVQWWRGYYSAVDLSANLESAVRDLLAEQENDPTSLEALRATNRTKRAIGKISEHSTEGKNWVQQCNHFPGQTECEWCRK